MKNSKSTEESPRTERNNSSKNTSRDKRSHREIVEANLKALKHTRLAFQR